MRGPLLRPEAGRRRSVHCSTQDSWGPQRESLLLVVREREKPKGLRVEVRDKGCRERSEAPSGTWWNWPKIQGDPEVGESLGQGVLLFGH